MPICGVRRTTNVGLSLKGPALAVGPFALPLLLGLVPVLLVLEP